MTLTQVAERPDGTSRPARLPMPVRESRHVQTLMLSLGLMFGMLPTAEAMPTKAGTTIHNVAGVTYDTALGTSTESSSNPAEVVTQDPLPEQTTPAQISFLQYVGHVNPPDAQSLLIGPTRCDAGGGSLVPMPAPVALDGTVIDPTGPVALLRGDVYHRGEPMFVQVADADHNTSPHARNTVLVELSVDGTGDRELLELTETGPDTGVFVGHIMSARPPALQNNCELSVDDGDRITAVYHDFLEVTTEAAALVDPFGVVFDSRDGRLLDGVTITMIDADTGLPAAVFGDDGVSAYPSTVVTGGSATDASGAVYDFEPGFYRFPFVAPGNYRLVLSDLPVGYTHPSIVPDAALQELPGAPYAIELGSRGEVFIIVPGPALHIDIPLDPPPSIVGVDFALTKRADPGAAAPGDFVRWQVDFMNPTSTITYTPVSVEDVLPVGLRYMPGSTVVDGVKAADPEIDADGRTMRFHLGALTPGRVVRLTYVTKVQPGARNGTVYNSARLLFGLEPPAAGGGAQAPALAPLPEGVQATQPVTFPLLVQSDLFRDTTTLVGEVLIDSCGAAGTGRGAAGVRVLLEDGTYAVTDERGRYHFRGLAPGVHVVQVDTTTVPDGLEIANCAGNTRHAGRGFSQFVDLAPGVMWRADFNLRTQAPDQGSVTAQLKGALLVAEPGRAVYELLLGGTGSVAVANLRASLVLPDGATLVPDSILVDGESAAARVDGGSVTLRLGDVGAVWQRRVVVHAQLPADGIAHRAQAMVMFDAPTQRNARLTPLEVTLQPASASTAAGGPAPVTTPVERVELTTDQILFQPRFVSRGWKLSRADEAELRRLMEPIKGADSLRLHIVGHTDARPVLDLPSDDLVDNRDLSLRRARAVAEFLAGHLELPLARMLVEGRGADEPIAPDTDRGRALNRRVDIAVIAASALAPEAAPAATDAGVVAVAGAPAVLADESAVARLDITGANRSPAPAPVVIAPAETEQSYAAYAKPIDAALFRSLEPRVQMLWPSVDENPSIPLVKVAVHHPFGQRVELTVDGQPVSPLSRGGTEADASRTWAISTWTGVPLKDGANLLRATVTGRDGEVLASVERDIHFGGRAVRAELVEEQSRLVADGRQPSVIAVRILDRFGKPVRRGAQGEFRVLPPHQAFVSVEDQQRRAVFDQGLDRERWLVGEEGIALIQLAPTTASGEATLQFKFSDQVPSEVRAWLEPEARDWVLVGLAEGTIGHRTVTDNMQAYEDAGGTPGYYEDGRLAFYAKGRVKGEYLLTMAYDTRRDAGVGGAALTQQVDPNAYYLLYGDATEQRHDAASIRNLYLRIEKRQFYAMFGDFDTGLTVTELGRYARRMNGAKTEVRHGDLSVTAFASENTQSFVKDELPGDGTSGLYRLSRRPLLVNSERITIETRDRFHNEQVIATEHLTRHLDYTIDYTGGTLFFKRPVPARDAGFNPVYVVADYEVRSTGEGTVTGGGRVAQRLAGGKAEVGATVIHDGVAGSGGDLYAADLKVKLTADTELRAEVATSESQVGAVAAEGDAHLVELRHQGERVSGIAYLREQETGFGLGQQSGGERGTRKLGVEGQVRVSDQVLVEAEAFTSENLTNGATRDALEGALRYETDDFRRSATVGLRQASERGLAGGERDSSQAFVGGTQRIGDAITLRAQAEASVAGDDTTTQYPDKLMVGADYQLSTDSSLFVEHEMADGATQDTEMTRVGVRAGLWSNARLDSALEQQDTEDGARVFATVGLAQTFQVREDLALDFGIDRVQTLKQPGDPVFDPDHTPAVGTLGGDFTAWRIGASWKHAGWMLTGRFEDRSADDEDRHGLQLGAYRQQTAALGLSLGFNLMDSERITGASSTTADLRLGLAWRPTDPDWIVYDRVDLVFAEASDPASGPTRTWKLINNLNANWRPVDRWQTSFQYGAKWTRAELGAAYEGFTDLLGVESRFDLTPHWDVGAQVGALHDWEAGNLQYTWGLSVGRDLFTNVWVSFGYNFDGYYDPDFSAARYTARGPYLQFRIKFDQDSVRDAAAAMGGTPLP